MREILFRGKLEATEDCESEWIFGDLLSKAYDTPKIRPIGSPCNDRVPPETIGQYTGLTDKNGKKIFEGDIVMIQYGASMILFYEVVYQNDWARFALKSFGKIRMCDAINERIAKRCEVVGNVHDNPELVKGD